ncbi:CheR family methyltransferase [Marinitoga sp. 38H-ov]|uniref:CheR family methyltransferase n=1 Tax=Marinitoga sp. 38H-ov TaxID=1755814 RepID=UPI0013ECC717|nr:CheR family methyltransferase [Marinitoga sp. 38H-ov]KAF2956221.1 hypothetical protein AS160_07010 [Marinitoga sp. 38H-ov]
MVEELIKSILKKYGLKEDKKRLEHVKNTLSFFKNLENDQVEKLILENYTIGESYFFRDENLWETIKSYIIENKKYNILSLGCSRGEEVYTFSFILNNLNKDYKIIGIDASNYRIKQAIEGKYKYWSIRKLNQGEIDKYFEKRGEFYYVKEKYKKNIEFKVDNITNYIKTNNKYDVILLRRVLIYFTEHQITYILKNIKNILNDNGILILGHGEFYPYLTEIFDFEIHNNVVLWKKANKEIKFISNKTNKIKNIIKIKDSKKEKLINTIVNISEDEYIEIIEKLISEKNYVFAYSLIKKIADNSINYLIWKYKAFLEIQLNLDYKDSLNKAIFLNPDDEELWNMKYLNENRG